MFSDYIAIRRHMGDSEGEKYVSTELHRDVELVVYERLADKFLALASVCARDGDIEGEKRYYEMRAEVIGMMEKLYG